MRYWQRASASMGRTPCLAILVMRRTCRARNGEERGTMSRTIDTHTHVLADEAIKRLQKEIPSLGLKLTPVDADNGVIEVAGVPYKPFPRGGHDIARRLADMDAALVDMQVVTATPQTWLYGQEAVGRRSALGNPERRHGAADQASSGPLRRHRHAADAGAATGRRRIAPRHGEARHARRHDRLQYQRQEFSTIRASSRCGRRRPSSTLSW